jgi:hypothetical protein
MRVPVRNRYCGRLLTLALAVLFHPLPFLSQYFLASDRPRINRLILQTLKDCDANGVKVFGLGALNKVS